MSGGPCLCKSGGLLSSNCKNPSCSGTVTTYINVYCDGCVSSAPTINGYLITFTKLTYLCVSQIQTCSRSKISKIGSSNATSSAYSSSSSAIRSTSGSLQTPCRCKSRLASCKWMISCTDWASDKGLHSDYCSLCVSSYSCLPCHQVPWILRQPVQALLRLINMSDIFRLVTAPEPL
jgi:hypothetical protein